MSVLSRPYFHDEEKAFEYLESVIWADGKVCPHCGGVERITKVKANPAKRIRLGLWRCGDCKRQFTVKVGTVFEHARLPLNKALQATYLMTSSKKGISAHQLHRVLEVTYKTAWFLATSNMLSERWLHHAICGTIDVSRTPQGFEITLPQAYHSGNAVVVVVREDADGFLVHDASYAAMLLASFGVKANARLEASLRAGIVAYGCETEGLRVFRRCTAVDEVPLAAVLVGCASRLVADQALRSDSVKSPPGKRRK